MFNRRGNRNLALLRWFWISTNLILLSHFVILQRFATFSLLLLVERGAKTQNGATMLLNAFLSEPKRRALGAYTFEGRNSFGKGYKSMVRNSVALLAKSPFRIPSAELH